MPNHPRVALVTARFPAASETFIASLFERLLQRGWDVHAVCRESPAADRAFYPQLDRATGRIHTVWRRSALLVPFALARCLFVAPRRTIRYLVRGWRRFGSRVLRTLYIDAELIVLGPDLVHFQFGNFAHAREHLSDLLGCAVVVSFQGADLNYAGLDRPGYYDEVFASADGFHFLGEDLRRRAERRGFVPDGRDAVIKPGVDASTFRAVARDRPSGRPVRVLSVGRLHWKKGYEYAIAAIADLVERGVDVEYRVVGDGDFRPAVEHAIAAAGLGGRVQLLGAVPLEAVREQMAWADVLLHAAVSEGFCYVALEAQATRLPVVTSDADGLPENVEHGRTGSVVPRRDARALADGISRLVADDALREAFGDAARARVESMFDPDRQIEGFERLYRLALERAGGRS